MRAITTTYREHVITYDESRNSWNAEFFSLPADSLERAKARIDAHLDTEKKAPFKPIDVYTQEHGFPTLDDGFARAKVTSVTDDKLDAWFSAGKNRKKIRLGFGCRAWEITPHNTELVKVICSLNSQIDSLKEQVDAAFIKMKALKP